MTIYKKEAGVWQPVVQPSPKSAGAFSPAKKVFIKDGGVWNQAFDDTSGPSLPPGATHRYEMEEKQGDLVKNEITGIYDGDATPLEIVSGGLYGNCLTNTESSNQKFSFEDDTRFFRTIVIWITYNHGKPNINGMANQYDYAVELRAVSSSELEYRARKNNSVIFSDYFNFSPSGGFDFIAIRIPEGSLEHYINFNENKYTAALTEESDLPMKVVAYIGENGLSDQAWGFERALTDEEIATLYNNGSGIPFP